MAITVEQLTDFAPALASLSDGELDAAVAHANLQLDADVWGDWLEMGLLNLAAHLGTMAARRGTAGSVQSEAVGQVSRSYAVSVAADGAALRSTAYGAEYQRLANLLNCARGPWVL